MSTHVEAAHILANAGIAAASEAEELLAAITTYTFGDSRAPLSRVQEWIRAYLEQPVECAALALSLSYLLTTDATYDCKDFICRQLALIGTEKDVRSIAPLLKDEKTADMARYALHSIPGEAADKALAAALKGASGTVREGIENTIAERKDAKARA